MHLAEGVLPLGQAAIWSAMAAPPLVWSLRAERVAHRESPASPLLMAGVTSLLFAATLLPLPVPVVGATSHICMTPVLALLVGVRRIIWPTFFVLLLQALFFAHGGLTTLGVNTLTLGVLGPMVTVAVWAATKRIGAPGVIGIGLACGVGGLSVYVADAFVLAVALSDVAPPAAIFGGVVIGFAPVQIPLAVLEAAVSGAMVRMLARRRPDLLTSELCEAGGRPTVAFLSSILVVVFAAALSGCSYEGVDGSVFSAAARSAGRPPTDSLMDFSQGELGLAASIVILFSLGFIAGRTWERLLGGRDAFPR